MANNNFKQGFVKRAAQYGLSNLEAEVVFEKTAQGMGMMGGGPGQPPAGGPPQGQHAGGMPEVSVNGQPLPPELAHLVIQVLQKVSQGAQGGAGGPPQGGHPGMSPHGM